MALEQLSPTTLISAIIDRVQSGTELSCYDYVEDNTPSPFYFVELLQKVSDNTKTMWRDIFTVNIHAIAEPSHSSVPIFQMIDNLQEAMTEDIELPSGFILLLQVNSGVQTVQTDETNEKHAVMTYEFDVCYGYKIKEV